MSREIEVHTFTSREAEAELERVLRQLEARYQTNDLEGLHRLTIRGLMADDDVKLVEQARSLRYLTQAA